MAHRKLNALIPQESSQDERSAAALHAVHLDDKYGGAPVQVRVVQSKEPDHFLLVFKGRMVVHSGGRASGFKNRFDQDSYDVDGTRLFHVRGMNEFDTRAVQVEEKASSLNSNDCFVLETPQATYIWYGKVSLHSSRQWILITSNSFKSFWPGSFNNATLLAQIRATLC